MTDTELDLFTVERSGLKFEVDPDEECSSIWCGTMAPRSGREMKPGRHGRVGPPTALDNARGRCSRAVYN